MPQITNIVSILAIIIATIRYFVPSSNQKPPGQVTLTPNTFTIVIFIILIAITIISLLFQYITNRKKGREKKYQIIQTLSELQSKYISNAEFKTTKEHSEHSKERDLKRGGDARILTNSLMYDMFYCKYIATNINNDATYVYIIPHKPQVLNELKSYIEELYNELHNIYNDINDQAQKDKNVKNVLTNNVRFHFLETDILCLYNFAKLNQSGASHFTQFWWYVNPKEHDAGRYLLSHNIIDPGDQDLLHGVFDDLERVSIYKNAYDIHKNPDNLKDLFRK
jgi:hypothetical protein